MKFDHLIVGIAVCAALAASAASAHVVFENPKAAVGSSYKGVFQVTHGCEGSATVNVRVQIPEGVIAVKPMPKAGWTIETIKGKYAASYAFHGKTISEGVKEVVWSGGKLPDDFFDEFVLATFLTDGLKAEETLYFPVIQQCESGANRWVDLPEKGQSHAHHGMPAPGLKLLPKR